MALAGMSAWNFVTLASWESVALRLTSTVVGVIVGGNHHAMPVSSSWQMRGTQDTTHTITTWPLASLATPNAMLPVSYIWHNTDYPSAGVLRATGEARLVAWS